MIATIVSETPKFSITDNPYVDVEIKPLKTEEGTYSNAKSVIADAPGGEIELGTVSSNYLLVPNKNVKQMADEVLAQTGFQWTEPVTYWNGKQFSYIREAVDGPEIDVEAASSSRVGDTVGIGAMFNNSYDGTRRFGFNFFLKRLICSNGMVSKILFNNFSFKHDNTSVDWEEEVLKATSSFEGLPSKLEEFKLVVDQLNDSGDLDFESLKDIRLNYIDKVPSGLWGRIVDQFLNEDSETAWGLLNAATNILWHDDKKRISDLNWNQKITDSFVRYAGDTLKLHAEA